MRTTTTTDTSTNGGGEASATGNTLGISDPLTSNMFGILKRIVAFNNTGANGTLLCDFDSATIATVLGTVADFAKTVSANQTSSWTEEDFFLRYITDGIVYQASNAATGSGWKLTFEVDWHR